MVETFFGLSRRPFLAIPDVNSYFPSETIDFARTNALRCLHRGEGISLIIGQSGVGKTLLLRLLGLPFHLDYAVVNISNHRLKTPKAFLQQLLFELQQPFCGSEENELRLLLWDHLRRSSLPGVILLVDEGQTLSLSVLEEIRQMLNCDNGLFSRFRIAIAGTLKLEERLTHPKLKAFNQWIVSRSYLEPLTRSETSEYILWQTQIAQQTKPVSLPSQDGSSRTFRIDSAHQHSEQFSLFDDLARTKIYEMTGGIPRLINQLCDHALVLACETNHAQAIDESLIRTAWANLQQIPQTNLEGKSFHNEEDSSCGSIIEFGTFDDDSSEKEAGDDVAEKEEHTPPFFSGDEIDEDEIDTDVISQEELDHFYGETMPLQEPQSEPTTLSPQAEEFEPLVQKPNEHVYQVKSFYKAAYPNGPEQAMCNWSSPGHQVECGVVECGVGTPYREILYRDLTMRESTTTSSAATYLASVALPPGMVVNEAKTDDSRQSLSGFWQEETAECPETQVFEPTVDPPFEPKEAIAPTPVFKPEHTVIRLHIGREPDRKSTEATCQKSSRLKTLQESFEEEIPVPHSQHTVTRPKDKSRGLVKSEGSQAKTETPSDSLAVELRQLQKSLVQGVAFQSAKRVATLLEETQKEGPVENEDHLRTLRFDPDASRRSSGSALSKPKFLTAQSVAEELITLDFQRESRKVSAAGSEKSAKKPEAEKMWIHSEPKTKNRPPLKLRRPTDDMDDLPSESVEEDETPVKKRTIADFDAFFSKFYG